MRVVVAPDVAADAVAALELWTAATDGEFNSEVTVSGDCTGAELCVTQVDSMEYIECLGEAGAGAAIGRKPIRACSWRDPDGLHRIVLNAGGTLPEERVSTFAHEVGHRLGLPHMPGTGDLMDPARTRQSRVAPCVSAEDVAAAAFRGPGACQ